MIYTKLRISAEICVLLALSGYFDVDCKTGPHKVSVSGQTSSFFLGAYFEWCVVMQTIT